jgi:hypothetical protein
MTLAATFLGGAKSRLLPASVPFRFFGAAAVLHVAGWAVLVYAAPDLIGFEGGPGLPLAALHLFTLGVLTMTAMGAAVQLLPVATRQALPTIWPVTTVFWLMAAGVPVLAYGLVTLQAWSLFAGGGFVTAALVGFGFILADNLRRAKDLPLVAAFGWVAVVSLVALLGFGLALAVDFRVGWLPDRAAVAHAHMIVAGYGFMGMLALGFSHVLIPMFALSPAPDRRLGTASLWTTTAGLMLTLAGILAAAEWVLLLGIAAGAVGIGLHLRVMAAVMSARMRKRMGISFVLVRAAWLLLPTSVVLGLLVVLDLGRPSLGTLFGFVLIFGWLLTFVTAILQRIMPFLGSMHARRIDGKAPLVSALSPQFPLKVHAFLHLSALILIAAGIVADRALLLRLGAAAGLGGALAFAAFAAFVLARIWPEREGPQ